MLTTRIDCRLSYHVDQPAHLLFNVQASRGDRQFVVDESTEVHQPDAPRPRLREFVRGDGNRIVRFDAQPGELTLRYRATVEKAPWVVPDDLQEVPVSWLPDTVLPYLMPSRFCESDVMAPTANELFGAVPPGISRVCHIRDWIHDHLQYLPGSSDAQTTALHVYEQKKGVCRDFAHLGITLCRALGIPARLAVGYVRFDEPPQDFHAIFEAWLGNQWVAFDPTRMAPARNLVRVGAGTDAKDVAFATMYGAVRFERMEIGIEEHGSMDQP